MKPIKETNKWHVEHLVAALLAPAPLLVAVALSVALLVLVGCAAQVDVAGYRLSGSSSIQELPDPLEP